MKQYRCLIVEDEPLAAEILSDYVEQVPFLTLAGVCTHGLQAIEYLQAEAVDLLFLDLHLPGLKGFDFLRTLRQRPKVIVTTAYHQYALEGYELNVLDYLLKPVAFPRFLMAVNKLLEQVGSTATVAHQPSPILPEKEAALFFAENRKQVRLFPSEITYLESQKDYVMVHTDTRTISTKSTLHDLTVKLPADQFMQIHRSFVVNITRINAFSLTEVELGSKLLPIGRSYRKQVEERLAKQ